MRETLVNGIGAALMWSWYVAAAASKRKVPCRKPTLIGGTAGLGAKQKPLADIGTAGLARLITARCADDRRRIPAEAGRRGYAGERAGLSGPTST